MLVELLGDLPSIDDPFLGWGPLQSEHPAIIACSCPFDSDLRQAASFACVENRFRTIAWGMKLLQLENAPTNAAGTPSISIIIIGESMTNDEGLVRKNIASQGCWLMTQLLPGVVTLPVLTRLRGTVWLQ